MTLSEHLELLEKEISTYNRFPLKIKKTVLTSNTDLTERLGKYGCNIFKIKKYFSTEEFNDDFVRDIVEDSRIPTKLSLLDRASLEDCLTAFKEHLMRYYQENYLYEK